MSNGAMVSGATGATVAIVEATKAMGSIVVLGPEEFLSILQRQSEPVVVYSAAGFLAKHKYLTSYKGLVFFTKSKDALLIPASIEVINAKKIFVPQM